MRPVITAAGGLAFAALFAGPTGCRQVVGIESSPEIDLATSACGLPFGTPACAACASGSCCSESKACADDAECAPYGACMGPCEGDPKCWAECLVAHRTDAPAATSLGVCMAKSCETACGLTCGAFAGVQVDPDTAVGCQACIVSHACSETRACATSSDCNAIQHCIALCSTEDCADECQRVHGADPAFSFEPDGGTTSVSTTFSTARTSCSVPCARGGDWACAGHVSWSEPKSPVATYNFWLEDFATLGPVTGATVALCGAGDEICASPIMTQVTDGSGLASLTFQNSGRSGALGSGFSGFLLVTAPGYVPDYFYWGYPLSEAESDSYGELSSIDSSQSAFDSIGVKQDPARGFLVVGAYDCLFETAPGVTVTVDTADSLTKAFTTSGVQTMTTDNAGILVFANVPAGTVHVTATPTGLGRATGTVTAVIHAQAETTVGLFPTP